MTWSIRNKLLASFGTIILFVVVLGGVSYNRIDSVGVLGMEIAHHDEIAYIAGRMHTEVLQARRREKDFFLRNADPQYLTSFDERAAAFNDLATELRGMAVERETLALVDESTELMETYVAAFRRAAQQRTTRGHEDSGKVGELREVAHTLEELITGLNDDRLMVRYLMLRRHEKDFMLRGGTTYVERFREGVALMGNAIQLSLAAPETKLRMAAQLDAYATRFTDLVTAETTLATSIEEYRAAAQAVEPLVERLAQESLEVSLGYQASIATERDAALSLIIGVLALLVIVATGLSRQLARQITTGVTSLVDSAGRIKRGDLSQPITVQTDDELGDLAAGYDSMRVSLAVLMRQLGANSGALQDLAENIRQSTSEQAAGVTEQAASVTETMATVEQISRSSAQVAARADEVVSSAAASVESSQQGTQALDRAVEGMTSIREQVESIAATILDLSQKTQQIGAIIATVNDIAEQSNLLALNASIEAARAGEQGKAFAVVAGEVRGLAERSQRATNQVRDILSDIQQTTNTAVMVTEEGSKRVDRGIELVGAAGEVLNELAATIEESAQIAEQIAASTGQQAAGIKQISVAMGDINRFAEDNVVSIRRIEGVAGDLLGLSGGLRSTVATYRVD